MPEVNWDLALKIVASVLAATGVFWGVFIGLRDRSKLQVLAGYGRTHHADVGPDVPEEEFLVITAVNKGRRPMTIVSAGVTLPDGRKVIIESCKFPAQLSEAQVESFKVNFKYVHILPVSVWVRDSTGKLHTSRKKFTAKPVIPRPE